jgi:hypothetical protein
LRGSNCPHDCPTLLVENNGKKVAVDGNSSYSSVKDSHIPMSGMSGISGMSNNNEDNTENNSKQL